jgi:DNA-binding transcriptional MerR regulator
MKEPAEVLRRRTGMRMEKSADAFRTISEVAEDLDLPQHVLRFWETRFTQIKPLKRAGGRRFYRPDDIELLRAIQQLLYGEGYTIKGVQKLLKDQGIHAVIAGSRAERAGAAQRPKNAALAAHAHGEMGEFLLEEDMDEPGYQPNAMISGDTDCAHAAVSMENGAAQAKRQAIAADTATTIEKLLAELTECQRILDVGRRG